MPHFSCLAKPLLFPTAPLRFHGMGNTGGRKRSYPIYRRTSPCGVDENTSATLMTTTDYDSCREFVTRKAPFMCMMPSVRQTLFLPEQDWHCIFASRPHRMPGPACAVAPCISISEIHSLISPVSCVIRKRLHSLRWKGETWYAQLFLIMRIWAVSMEQIRKAMNTRELFRLFMYAPSFTCAAPIFSCRRDAWFMKTDIWPALILPLHSAQDALPPKRVRLICAAASLPTGQNGPGRIFPRLGFLYRCHHAGGLSAAALLFYRLGRNRPGKRLEAPDDPGTGR